VKVLQLIDLLSEYQENAEVRLVTQPHWPLEHGLDGIVSKSEIDAHEADDDEDTPEPEIDVVYLLEGSPHGYGRRAAWDAWESNR
jgi:hypothetical protein